MGRIKMGVLLGSLLGKMGAKGGRPSAVMGPQAKSGRPSAVVGPQALSKLSAHP